MTTSNPDAVDLGPEMTEGVQPALLGAPIKGARPVRREVPQVSQVRALRPRNTGGRAGPPRVPDAGPQVGEDLVADPDGKRLGLEGCHHVIFASADHALRHAGPRAITSFRGLVLTLGYHRKCVPMRSSTAPVAIV